MTGAITPAMLTLLLRPYGFEVTQRCLTDWRQKGFLPPLARVSRGFRGGVLRCWNETDILRRALAVCRRLRGVNRKREFGSVYRNWLSGADIPPLRAQEAWIRDLRRRARMPKLVIQKASTEIGAELGLKTDAVRDTIEELCRIALMPNYTAGRTQDIFFIRNFIRRAFDALGASKTRQLVGDEFVPVFLVWVNAAFSPAGMRSLIASATSGELRHARDSYRNWWVKAGAFKPRLNADGDPEPSFSTILAELLAPLIVPFLLPNKLLDGRLAQLEAV